jgi:hypothetical protein
MSMELAITQSFDVLKRQCESIATVLDALNITDDNTEAIATQRISEAKEALKNLDEKRKELKAPALEQGRLIDEAAKKLSSLLSGPVEASSKKLLVFKQEKEAKKKKELEALEAKKKIVVDYQTEAISFINNCNSKEELSSAFVKYVQKFPSDEEWGDLAESAKEVLTNIKKAGSQKLKAIVEGVPTAPIEVPIIATNAVIEDKIAAVAVQKTGGIVRTWDWDLFDKMQVPLDLLTVDTKKVDELMKALKENGELVDGAEKVVYGIKFYQKETLRVK